MDGQTSETSHLAPRDFGVRFLAPDVNPLRGLGQDLKVAQYCILYQSARAESRSPILSVLFDPDNTLENVFNVERLVLHSGTASLITRSRI